MQLARWRGPGDPQADGMPVRGEPPAKETGRWRQLQVRGGKAPPECADREGTVKMPKIGRKLRLAFRCLNDKLALIEAIGRIANIFLITWHD